MGETILDVKGVSCSKAKGQPIFTNVNFTVDEGDIVVLSGKSGAGKTTLLKCLAHLNLYEGEILYRGKTPQSYGIPNFRTHILYVPQRPSILPGTPRDFLHTVSSFSSQIQRASPTKSKKAARGRAEVPDRPIDLAESWGIEEHLWDRNWTELSGGEVQRISLAIAVGMETAEVILLDEPTSALDAATSKQVEDSLISAVESPEAKLKAIVWITHSDEQGRRVGTRFLQVTGGGIVEVHPATV